MHIKYCNNLTTIAENHHFLGKNLIEKYQNICLYEIKILTLFSQGVYITPSSLFCIPKLIPRHEINNIEDLLKEDLIQSSVYNNMCNTKKYIDLKLQIGSSLDKKLISDHQDYLGYLFNIIKYRTRDVALQQDWDKKAINSLLNTLDNNLSEKIFFDINSSDRDILDYRKEVTRSISKLPISSEYRNKIKHQLTKIYCKGGQLCISDKLNEDVTYDSIQNPERIDLFYNPVFLIRLLKNINISEQTIIDMSSFDILLLRSSKIFQDFLSSYEKLSTSIWNICNKENGNDTINLFMDEFNQRYNSQSDLIKNTNEKNSAKRSAGLKMIGMVPLIYGHTSINSLTKIISNILLKFLYQRAKQNKKFITTLWKINDLKYSFTYVENSIYEFIDRIKKIDNLKKTNS